MIDRYTAIDVVFYTLLLVAGVLAAALIGYPSTRLDDRTVIVGMALFVTFMLLERPNQGRR